MEKKRWEREGGGRRWKEGEGGMGEGRGGEGRGEEGKRVEGRKGGVHVLVC